MDWKRIEHDLMWRVNADDRRERERDIIRRIRLHYRYLRKLRKKLNPRVALKVIHTEQWKRVRQALERGERIISFDAEWQYQWPHKITELGVAIYHNGHREVHNIRVRAGAGKVYDPMTKFMTDDQAKRWLRLTFKDAGLLVGHAIQNDRMKMKEWGWPLPEPDRVPVVDTERWSRTINVEADQAMKLTTFCRHHGVEIIKSHIAGNDALMTLNVALALASIEDEEYVRAA